MSKCGGAKSAVALLRGPGAVGCKVPVKDQTQLHAMWNIAGVPSHQAIRRDDAIRCIDKDFLYGVSRPTIRYALAFGRGKSMKRIACDETESRRTSAA